jgi:hypothetical protein
VRGQLGLITGNGVAQDERGRHKNDFYETPAFQTGALMARVPICGTVFEPCAGRGAILRALEPSPFVLKVIGNEPYEELAGGWRWRLDATQRDAWRTFGRFAWIVTNPPFDRAHEIIPLAYEHARIGIAFLLRITYYEPAENRAEWLDAHPPDAIIALPRYRYRKDTKSGDSATTAWFVWLKPYAGITVSNSVVTRAECKRLEIGGARQ